MRPSVTFPVGGDNVTLTVTLQDSSDLSPVDLTGGSVRLTIDRGDGTTFEQAGSLITPASGTCQFLLKADGALAEAGRYSARVTATVGVQITPSEVFALTVE